MLYVMALEHDRSYYYRAVEVPMSAIESCQVYGLRNVGRHYHAALPTAGRTSRGGIDL